MEKRIVNPRPEHEVHIREAISLLRQLPLDKQHDAYLFLAGMVAANQAGLYRPQECTA